ncbi:RelA/SpoT family protein, partial [Flavobacteriaceae bacterium]|nr:RelA/SpoT family protein [Flavobacteriaceae bacterium]
NTMLKSFAASRSNAFVNFFKNRIRRPQNNEEVNKEELTVKYDQLVFGKDEEKLDYKMSPCCNPIPGDDVFGFLTINDGIKVHKTTCPNAIQMQSNYNYRILKAQWIDSTQREFQATLKISGIDTFGMVNSVTKVVSNNLHIDMKSVHFDTNDGTFTGTIVVKVKNKSILDNLVKNIKKINGIDKVSRV